MSAPAPLDSALAELHHLTRRTTLWDDQEREELYLKLCEAHRERGLEVPEPLPV